MASLKPWLVPGIPRVQALNSLGEKLYPLFLALVKAEPTPLPPIVNAGRITGMTLDLPLEEASALLDDPAALKAIYEQAKTVLLASSKN